jgi:prepilin-type N-terminal cleavage/methylation domain-containing protein
LRAGRRAGPAARRRAGAGGFTLVEIMVTLALTAVFFSMIGTILVSFLETQKKVEATLLRERVGAAILEVIARDVEGSYVYDIEGAWKGVDERGGGGDADRFEFITTRDPAVREEDEEEERRRAGSFSGGGADEEVVPRDPPQLTRIVYSTRDSRAYPGLLTLFRAESLYVPPPPAVTSAGGGRSGTIQPGAGAAAAAAATAGGREPVERFMEVYDRVKSFNVRYLKVDRSAQQAQGGAPPPGEWKDSWDDAEETPAAIEVLLEIVADPRARNGEGQDRARKVYRTVVAIPVTKPVVQRQQGQSPPG